MMICDFLEDDLKKENTLYFEDNLKYIDNLNYYGDNLLYENDLKYTKPNQLYQNKPNQHNQIKSKLHNQIYQGNVKVSESELQTISANINHL